ncbi:ribonuclease HII [Corynebacterium uterequi]|uniref:Ribonuclease HII n=1 Tax=Corynebacterium uterequi TaxID=1072256 RepID=A0A0G3HD99_9CORY|nr:ribonuclease HII [Corynebacterium uterequi]AKK11361.1 RNase HII [Corynebacterium uterequi]
MGRLRRLKQSRTYEVALVNAGLGPVVGVDEAGRGACAGPLTVAACALPPRVIPALDRLDDSKKLTPRLREELFDVITRVALDYEVVSFEASAVDHYGVHTLNREGMRLAVERLRIRPGYVLTDAWRIPSLRVPHLPIIGGDATARCIAAASVLAKVTRDRVMDELAVSYPVYRFDKHKGYSTKAHLDAVRRHGASPQHRYTYANVAAAHAEWEQR